MKIYNSHEYVRQLAASHVPDMRYQPETDFQEWQMSARRKLEQLLGLPLKNCGDEFEIVTVAVKEGYQQLDFEFQSEPGYFIPCSLLIPENASGPLPTFLCLQGHSTGKHISLGVEKFETDAKSIAGGRDFALQTVRQGFCAVVMDQRYMGTAGHNANGRPACVTTNDAMAALLMGRTALGERVWDIMRLIDVLENHLKEYVDPQSLMCMGNSGGGTATFYAACMDERISLAMPSCAVCSFDTSIMSIYHCSCNFVPGIRLHFDMGDLGALIAPRKLVIVCGLHDAIFPLEGVTKSFEQIYEVYKMLGAEKNCRLVKGAGGHQFYPDESWPVVQEFF